MDSGRFRAAALATSFAVAAGCVGVVDSPTEDLALNAARQQNLASTNGLVSVNGFRSRNGLISAAALSSRNGLRSNRFGGTTINGLTTRDGRFRRDGLYIDCTDRKLGYNCTGEPDGLLDADTGLMSSDDGIQTAVYVVRCALAADDAVRVKDYTGGLVSLNGEVGLTPQWKEDDCDEACQEKISACLMAFTNGDGAHVAIELSARFTLGLGHSDDFPYQEAAFYGNLFTSPPEAYFCVGADYATVDASGTSFLEMRACEGYNSDDGSCPYVNTGLCNDLWALGLSRASVPDGRCAWTGLFDDTAASCLAPGAPSKRWQYPITTFRQSQQ